VLVGHAAHALTCCVAVFVRWGSAHEPPVLNGVGHVLEHMAFKGTEVGGRRHDARAVNLAAERLGAEVNAHTDKDHTAYYMRGLPEHADELLRMLAEIVLHPSLPADELERERQVLLQEFAEDEDDPVATAFKLFDKASFGLHAAAQPVMGKRHNLERFTREDLLAHRAAGYLAGNIVVGVHGPIEPGRVLRGVERLFGAVPVGHGAFGAPGARDERAEHSVIGEPAWHGGVRTLRLSGSSQAHLVMGYPAASRRADDPRATVAAAVLGEGMSSPLLYRVREQRALAYYAACSADVLDMCGQFVIEASLNSADVPALLAEVKALLHEHAEGVAAADLERARHQLAVRERRVQERGLRWLEDRALEWLSCGRLLPAAQRAERTAAVTAADVRQWFEQRLVSPPAVALTGDVPRGMRGRIAAGL
jgi:predicted Zn-dependent peptidase